MSVLIGNDLSKRFGPLDVFQGVDLRVEKGDRIGLVGHQAKARQSGADGIVFALEKFEDIQGLDVFKRGAIVQRTTTDAAGAFSFSLFKGEHMIQVVVDHHVLDSRQIEVKGGRTTNLSFNIATVP